MLKGKAQLMTPSQSVVANCPFKKPYRHTGEENVSALQISQISQISQRNNRECRKRFVHQTLVIKNLIETNCAGNHHCIIVYGLIVVYELCLSFVVCRMSTGSCYL